MNTITFILYGIDKYNAIHNKYRISEKTLILFTLFGGVIGGIIGGMIFNHKARKWYFKLVNILALIIWICIYFLIKFLF